MPAVLKGAAIGCGFFAQHHIEAWRRMPEVEIVAAADLRLDRAEKFASRAYRSAEEMLDSESLDFVDIVTRSECHLPLLRLATGKGIPVICQKPIAPDWATALAIVEIAESAHVPLMVHENWRWQPWYRLAHEMLIRGDIGPPIGYGFRTRAGDGIGDQPYPEQAYFRDLRQFIIGEVLVHHIDTARFLFGDIDSIFAQTSRWNPNIAAEDQAILVLTHKAGVHGWIDGHRFLAPDPDGPVMGDAFFEGELGTISILGTGDVYRNNVRVWKNDITSGYRGDSVLATQSHFVSCLQNGRPFESAGRTYLRTFAAVEAAYRSVTERRCVSIGEVLAATADKNGCGSDSALPRK